MFLILHQIGGHKRSGVRRVRYRRKLVRPAVTGPTQGHQVCKLILAAIFAPNAVVRV
jgi:hypothetical protein